MLVLSRNEGQSIDIGGPARVSVVGVRGNRVKVGVDAPRETPIRRTELPVIEDAEPRRELIYLASPYTHPERLIREERFDAVCRFVARLVARGVCVFSPIAHSHPLTRYGAGVDWKTWETIDTEFIRRCDRLVVYQLPGWEESVGVKAEIELADKLGKPVCWIDPDAGHRRLDELADADHAVWPYK